MELAQPDNKITVLAERYEGKRLNEPNDLTADSLGRIYFSDPCYGRRDRLEIRDAQGRTVEGVYRIDYKSMQSRYTRALHISYPDERDRQRAQAMGVEPGGAIFVHGLPNDYGPFDPPRWYRDWTEGCISVGNVAITKIWDAVPDGTPIEIRP